MDKFKKLIREEKGFANQELLKLSDKLGEGLSGFTQENTTTQVRKFYNLVRVAKEQAEGKSDEAVKIKLRSLQAQVAYAAARGTISRDFKTFFDEAFKRILDGDGRSVETELKHFTTFFDSLYAYFYYHVERKKNRPGGKALKDDEGFAEAFLAARLLHAPRQQNDEQRNVHRGKDAAYDVFRALQINDSESKPAVEALALIAEDVLSSPAKARDGASPAPGEAVAGFKNFPIFLEAIDEKLSFGGRLLFAERLLNDPLARRVMGWNRAQAGLTLDQLFGAANQFAADLCQWEVEYFERIPEKLKACDIEDVLDFYDKLKAEIVQTGDRTCYFSLGHGSGWHKLTVGLLLEKQMGRETFEMLRRNLGLARDRLGNEFPKSRKLVMNGRQRAYRPFGRVKMEVAEFEPAGVTR